MPSRKKDSEAKKKMHLARFHERGDQVWKMLEDEYLEEVVQLRDDLADIGDQIKKGTREFSRKDLAIGIMAIAVYGELVRRSIDRKSGDESIERSMKKNKKD